MNARMLWTMTAMRSMDYALIPMDPISVAVKWDIVVMEGHAMVSGPIMGHYKID